MKKPITSLLLALMALVAAQPEAIAQKEMEKQFSGIERLEIAGGPLEVSYQGSRGTQEISLHAYLGPEEGQDEDLVFVTVGNTLKIAYNPDNNRNSNPRPSKKYLKINGPENIGLTIRNSSGRVVVNQVNSDKIYLTISSGQIMASEITGDLFLKGSSGQIEVEDIAGTVDCSMSSGMAILNQIDGDLDFSSTSGRLSASQVSGKVNAKMTSGSVTLDTIGELGELSVSSGLVRATNAGLGQDTHFRGSSGSFSITIPTDLAAYNYDLQASSGSLSVGNIAKAKKLVIDNGAAVTVKGQISSGRINIEN